MKKHDDLGGTRLDTQLHKPRLKEGIVARDTRIYLRVVEGPEVGRTFDLSTGGCYIIGRKAGDIPLSDSKVSYRHAELKLLGPDGFFVVDLASTNGTFLNGARVEKQKLRHADEIKVGDSLLRFDVLEKTLPVSRA